MNLRGGSVAGYGGAPNRVRNVNPGQARPVKCYKADDYDAFDSDVDEASTTQTMFMANLSSADPVTDEAGPSYDSDILSEGMNLRGGSVAGYGGAPNRVRNVNPGQARPVKCYNCNGTRHIARNYTQPKRPQNSEYYKD
nr:hypothetical protein [Tanacetum cinerariifolium]